MPDSEVRFHLALTFDLIEQSDRGLEEPRASLQTDRRRASAVSSSSVAPNLSASRKCLALVAAIPGSCVAILGNRQP
jgi:hypothetical protein